MSGDVLGLLSPVGWGGGLLASVGRETWDTGRRPTMRRTAPATENSPAPVSIVPRLGNLAF